MLSALYPETWWSPSVHGLTHCRRNAGAPSDTLIPDSGNRAVNRAGENSGHTLMLVPRRCWWARPSVQVASDLAGFPRI